MAVEGGGERKGQNVASAGSSDEPVDWTGEALAEGQCGAV